MAGILQITRRAALLLLAVAVAYFVAMKLGWLPPYGTALTLAVLALCAWLALELIVALIRALRRELGPLAFLGRALVLGGALLIFSGGLTSWLCRLQGFVILAEGETAQLSQRERLQDFTAGWLADLSEMNLELTLDTVELRGDKGDLTPRSSLTLTRENAPPRHLELAIGASVPYGPLRFHHGAFGYKPRIVITRGRATIFDEQVPFTTQAGEGEIEFVAEFTIIRHDLRVHGEVVLETLDEQGRGHPRLGVRVEHRGQPSGGGLLQLGHFADISEGYRIGFAGLSKWAEIDLTRRNYPRPMYFGAAMLGLGALLLLAGRAPWRALRAA